MTFSRVRAIALTTLSVTVLLSGCVAADSGLDDVVVPTAAPQLLGGDCEQLLDPVALGAVLGSEVTALPSLSLEAATLVTTAAGGVRCAWSGQAGLIELWVLPAELVPSAPRDVACRATSGLAECAIDVDRGGARVVGTLTDSRGQSADALGVGAQTLVRALPSSIPPIDVVPRDGATAVLGCADPAVIEAMTGSADSTALGVRSPVSAPAAVIDALAPLSASCLATDSGVSATIVLGGAFLVPALPPGDEVAIDDTTYARTFADPALGVVTIAAAGLDLVLTAAPTPEESQRVASSIATLVARG